jgi:hypothetical protein
MAGDGRFTFVSHVPYERERIHAAALYCSDGRVGDHIDDFLHNGLGLPHYDRVACPGGPVALADRFQAFWDARGIEEQIRFLTQVHDVKTIVLIAHEACAYYARRLSIPPDRIEVEQKLDLHKATKTVERIAPFVTVKRYMARRHGEAVGFEVV